MFLHPFREHRQARQLHAGTDLMRRPADVTPRRAEPSRVIILPGLGAPLERLLPLVATGDLDALASLQERTAGLVHLNIVRILRDPLRSAALTQGFFLDLRAEAEQFDPASGSALLWLLERAHRRAIDAATAPVPAVGAP